MINSLLLHINNKIKDILKNGTNWNKIDKNQVDILNEYNQFKINSPYTWLELVEYGDILFTKCKKEIKNDQEIRAKYIIEYMIHNDIFDLITMDGHGRF